jgi:hypothetical protein
MSEFVKGTCNANEKSVGGENHKLLYNVQSIKNSHTMSSRIEKTKLLVVFSPSLQVLGQTITCK